MRYSLGGIIRIISGSSCIPIIPLLQGGGVLLRHSLNSLNGGCIWGMTYGVIKGDTRTVDCSSCE